MASTLTTVEPIDWTVKDVIELLEGYPLERIRVNPAPGTATEKDVLDVNLRTGRICELIDGVLVEKTMGFFESRVAGVVLHFIEKHLDDHNVGIACPPDGFLRVFPGQVRAPDVSFVAWERLPGRTAPREPIPDLAPDLAVEVLSKGNTRREMERKLAEYFEAGARLVWYIDPAARSARAYTSPHDFVEVNEADSLDGGDVLPGFRLSLAAVFSRAERGSGSSSSPTSEAV